MNEEGAQSFAGVRLCSQETFIILMVASLSRTAQDSVMVNVPAMMGVIDIVKITGDTLRSLFMKSCLIAGNPPKIPQTESSTCYQMDVGTLCIEMNEIYGTSIHIHPIIAFAHLLNPMSSHN